MAPDLGLSGIAVFDPLPAVSLFSGCGPLHPQIQHMDPAFKGEVQRTRKVGFHFPRCRLFLSTLGFFFFFFAATVIQLHGAPHPLPHNWLQTTFVHTSSALRSDSTSRRFCIHRERRPLVGLCCFSATHHPLFCKESTLVPVSQTDA